MTIFNIEIFGDDAKAFCALTKKEKQEWIKKYTNQTSNKLIEEFLNTTPTDKPCGCGCK